VYSQRISSISTGKKLVFPRIDTPYLMCGSIAVTSRKGFLLIFSSNSSILYNITTVFNESGITFSNDGLKLQLTFSVSGGATALILFERRKLSQPKITLES
jgi:hypothetical protein